MGLSRFIRTCLVLSVIFSTALLVRAQSDSASLSGRVTDPTGAVIPRATVTVTNTATGIVNTAKTNGVGRYAFPALRAGVYSLSVSMAGFKQVTAVGLVLTVQAMVAHDVVLPVGGTNQTVTVSDRGADLTTSSAVSTVIDRQFVANIPLNGRTIQNLINLTPGVVVTQSSFGDGGQFSVNGQRADSNYFTVDGVSANFSSDVSANVRETSGTLPAFSATGTTSSLVSVDAIQEFRIQTSSFAPEFGRTPGAQVAITTRSGTNQFHGTAFEFFRNSALDANNWFNGFLGLPKAAERQNDFGGVLGGPIYRNKTFFFFSYEGSRLAQPTPQETLVPDAASRSLVPAPIQPLLKAFPLPNVPETPSQIVSGIAQFNLSAFNNSTLNATSLRLDDNLTSKWSIFARYDYAPSKITAQSESMSDVGTTLARTQTGTFGSTNTFGSNKVNEALFNWSRYNTQSSVQLTPFAGAIVPTQEQLYPQSEGNIPPPGLNNDFELNLIGVSLFDQGTIASNINRQINFVDNFSYQIRNHQLKFGLDWRRLTPYTRPTGYAQLPVFCGVLTCPYGPLPTPLSGTTLETLIISSNNVGLIFSNYSMYAQDTWQATPRMVLTYGLRWDINPTVKGSNVELQGFVNPYDVNNLTLTSPGTPLYPTKYGSVAPRIGLSYRIHDKPNRALIARGGFGVFYDLGSSIAGGVATQWPFLRIGVNFGTPFPPPADVAKPLPFSLNPPYGEVTTIDPKIQIPRTYQWNAALEQQVGPSQNVTLTYVGASGHDLMQNIVLYPTVVPSGETIESTGGSSSYNALQVQYQRNLYKRFQALASYTWSHSIDTQSVNGGFSIKPTSSSDLQLPRASSDFDVRNSLSVALTYNTPDASYHSLYDALLHGWAIDAIYIVQTATPVDLSATTFLSPASPLTVRPDFVPGVPYYLHGSTTKYPGGKALNPAAFTAPPPGSIGDVPRNFFRGFNHAQLDLAFHRNFPIYRTLHLQFRTEAFNVLNEPNFAGYNGSIFSPFFGQSQSTLNNALGAGSSGSGGLASIYQIGGPRSLQLGLKLIF